MGWINELYETYENASNFIGEISADEKVLLPIAHSTQNAQIEVVVDYEGNFIRARKVDKIDAVTILPVTEDSAARSSGIAPHPLCDKLIYVAGDYKDYVEDIKNKKFIQYYEAYIKKLGEWATSQYTVGKVKAIFQYLQKKCLVEDLINTEVLICDGTYLDATTKIEGVAQPDSLIRFRVEKSGQIGSETAVWKDKEVYNSYIEYYLSTFEEKQLCYATGRMVHCSEKHPSKIRNSADKSKLISANDESGFTYRGRFIFKQEANEVGYEVSQKAHNALKWLIDKQGKWFSDMVCLVWSTKSIEVVDITKDSRDIFDLDWDNEVSDKNILGLENISANTIDTRKEFADKLWKSVFTSRCELDNNEDIVMLTVQAATTGRLSMTYYNKFSASFFYKNVVNWHSECSWKHSYKYKDKQCTPFIGAPGLKDIVYVVYGVEQNDNLVVKDGVMKQAIMRLIPCVVEGKRIPYDMVYNAVRNASSPLKYSANNRKKVLSIACALVSKYEKEKNKEEWKMSLQKERNDRDYLYGRLIAIAQDAEEYAMYRNGLKSINGEGGDKSKRITNAERFMNGFQKRPYSTWMEIDKKLRPYLNSLKRTGITSYERQITEIINRFKEGEFENNKMLTPSYILGYSCQLQEMYNKRNSKKTVATTENE